MQFLPEVGACFRSLRARPPRGRQGSDEEPLSFALVLGHFAALKERWVASKSVGENAARLGLVLRVNDDIGKRRKQVEGEVPVVGENPNISH